MAPVIFIVPGLWEGPAAFQALRKALKTAGLPVHISQLASTGTTAAEGLTLEDDIAAVSRDLAAVVELAGAEGVYVFLHSAGGLICSAAMRGLTATSLQAAGKQGGVKRIIFMSCAFGLEGFVTRPTPTMQFFENSYFTCNDPRNLLFNDMTDSEAAEWSSKMQRQPANWDGAITYCGWREVPSLYIILETDRAIPLEVQEEMAQLAGSRIVRLDAGHMAQLTRTSEVGQIIIEEITMS
ncbi:alpha/beta-hydrolase [Aspergillus pseudoustus]|uniref:Alpha/beta-hydrolase n=1 Tax=Aspergillus pseudoustus TaxID=1810923 RepID=A0ABR4II89_9EURO